MQTTKRGKAMKKIALITAVIFGTAAGAQADLLVGWEFSGYRGDELQGTSTVVAANIVDPAFVSRGDGVGISNNAGRFNGNNWTEEDLPAAIAANDYFTWTIEAEAGFQFSVTNVSFNFQRSGTGGTDWALRSSLDSFSTNLASFTALGNSSQSVDLTAAGIEDETSVEFRFYGWGGSGAAGSAGFEGAGDDLTVSGSVSVIPEPGTIALIGSGFALLFGLRRRLRT
jgi:hypothetical protein